MARDHGVESLGFDESETLQDDDIVLLELNNGTRMRCVLLAVVELDGRELAVVGDADDEEGDLMVARYHAGAAERLTPLDDEAVIERVQQALSGLLPVPDEA